MPLGKSYSLVDRVLHYLAFSTPFVQKALCELENDLYGRRLETIKSEKEVFVAGLPRAGTTLVLELLYATGEFRTFTYRDMPFILAPLLWDKVSRPFQRKGIKKERAHGDGVEISFDSPEAFEEVIWLSYLKDRIITGSYLSPLTSEEYTVEFANGIRNAVKKLLVQGNTVGMESLPYRYLSKNNANLSRIELISELFPTSTILVPFRNPVAQVASLKKQHQRFIGQHKRDTFSRRYMRWLGHFEFGENFKPINYGGWLNKGMDLSCIDEEFWMQYWIAAYTYALTHESRNVCLVDFDGLLREGRPYLERISEYVGIIHKEKLIEGSRMLRLPTTHSQDRHGWSSSTWNAAQDVYTELRRSAI